MQKAAFGRIVRNNLLLLVAAAVVLGLATSFLHEAPIVFFGIFYLGQALVNLILALAQIGRGPASVGPAPYVLSVLLVLLIGFGACSGLFMIAGSLGNIN
jgi:hypothetical protein